MRVLGSVLVIVLGMACSYTSKLENADMAAEADFSASPVSPESGEEEYRGQAFLPEGSPGSEFKLPPGMTDLSDRFSTYSRQETVDANHIVTETLSGTQSDLKDDLDLSRGQEASAEPESVTTTVPTDLARLIVYRGELGMVVNDIDASMRETQALAESKGGYMQQAEMTWIVIRVPREVFQEVVDTVRQMGNVRSESIRREDVTKQVADIRLRLETMLQLRARYLEHLAKATEMEDILRVEREITDLTVEIERMQARLSGLLDEATMSTLTVRFSEPATSQRDMDKLPARLNLQDEHKWIGRLGIGAVLDWL